MKPSIPRGTRDFGPAEMQKRNYIFSILRRNFELFGYEPIETPAMENLSTLLGKYGDEGDNLIFKILNSAASIEGSAKDFYHLIEQYYILSKAGLPNEAYLGGEENAEKAGKKFLENWNTLEDLKGKISEYLDKIPSVKFDKVVEDWFFELKHKTVDSSLSSADIIEKLKFRMTEKALRYDLTVPFARYVVMNQHNLAFPFKRYQIQPVWRADRPQKGRYREFYQCDADIIGSNSLINELDLISLIDKSFSELKIPVVLKINNRKILAGIAERVGAPDRMVDIAIAIDKFEKIGHEGVEKELLEKQFSKQQIKYLFDAILSHSIGGDNEVEKLTSKRAAIGKLEYLIQSTQLGENETFKKGCEEIQYLLNNCKTSNIDIELDITLARGLNYYTGTIFEVKANAGTFTPSILGGGRYDDLTGIFGLPNMSGVGISFGVDRIYDVMEELNLFPESVSKTSSTKLLFAHFDESNRDHCIQLANELRKNNISCEVYPDIVKKIAKQFDYANKKNIPFVCVVGSNEMQNKRYMLKDMSKGTQEEMSLEDIIKKLK